jgi:DNA-binding HxlR family transcriptional regulator
LVNNAPAFEHIQLAGQAIDVFDETCPSRRALHLVADRWSVLVLAAVAQGVSRNGELRRRVRGISQKMLTHTLRELERNGLVSRTVFAQVPPRVEYGLTQLGSTLYPHMRALCQWSMRHIGEVEEARHRYDARPGDT